MYIYEVSEVFVLNIENDRLTPVAAKPFNISLHGIDIQMLVIYMWITCISYMFWHSR